MRTLEIVVLISLLCFLFDPQVSAQATNGVPVLSGAQLFPGFDMGIDTSRHRTDWLSSDPANGFKMVYPLVRIGVLHSSRLVNQWPLRGLPLTCQRIDSS